MCSLPSFIPALPVASPQHRLRLHLRLPAVAPRSRARHATVAIAVVPGRELSIPPGTQLPSNGPLSEQQVAHFFENGYVLVPQLVPPSALSQMRAAVSPEKPSARQNPLYSHLDFFTWRLDPIFKQIATRSKVAAAALQLTPLSAQVAANSRAMVVVQDAFFRMRGDNKGCGFHVDDPFFWPCPRDAPGPGINAWIALDDVTEDGGGLTIVPRSHEKQFLPFRKAIEGNTCMLAELDKLKNDHLESLALSPVMTAGDVILHTRWLFHRGNPFKHGSAAQKGAGIGRYSIRYMPGDALVEPIAFEDGKIVWRPRAVLSEAPEEDFPAVMMNGFDHPQT